VKTKTKILLWVIAGVVTVFVGAIAFLLWFSPGGMRSNYRVQDNDPKLLEYARRLVPIIKRIEAYESRTGRFPETLEDIVTQPSQIPGEIYYMHMPESNHYRVAIKLGWDPSLIFSSQDRSWIFDPGDGSPEKIIKLDAEQSAAPLPRAPQSGHSEDSR
jgi:hypothetical protein